MFQRSLGREWEACNAAEVRLRQEMVNKQLKNWAMLATPYPHNLKLHQTVLTAVIALLQLSFEYNPLFSVYRRKD
jgi:hypothetical protein